MNRELLFINSLRKLSLAFCKSKDESLLKKIKSHIDEHRDLVPEGNAAAVLHDTLNEVNENSINEEAHAGILLALSSFWRWFVCLHPLDFIFVGKPGNAVLIEDMLKETRTSCSKKYYTSKGERILDEILIDQSLRRPFLICDNSCKALMSGDTFIGYVNIDAININAYHNHIINTIRNHFCMPEILTSNLLRLEKSSETTKVILGSSFAYYGLHDSLLNDSVNMSIASGDFAFSWSVMQSTYQRYGVKHFVVMVGYFELFHELSKGLNGYFYLAKDFCTANNINYNYRPRQWWYKDRNLFAVPDESANEISQPYLPSLIAQLTLQEMKNATVNDPMVMPGKAITSGGYDENDVISETEIFGRLYDKLDNKNHNRDILNAMVDFVTSINGSVHFIIQPFTDLYNDNFHAKMKSETVESLQSIANGYSSFFVDLSHDKDFNREDFSDAHHLNIDGSQKLINKLFWLNL